MLDAERVTKLAEAVADGQTPDWSSADQFAADDRELIAELRAVASIGALFGTISGSGPSHAAARTPLTPGSTWATLHILAHVGAGRFGDVYKAWDPALDREVALKLMSRPEPDDTSDSQVVGEGRLMARVHHPNVVSVFGAQRIGETTGLWMEFVEGRTLAEELSDRGPFDACLPVETRSSARPRRSVRSTRTPVPAANRMPGPLPRATCRVQRRSRAPPGARRGRRF